MTQSHAWTKITISRNISHRNINTVLGKPQGELGRQWPQMDIGLFELVSDYFPVGIEWLRTSWPIYFWLLYQPGSVISLRWNIKFERKWIHKMLYKSNPSFWHPNQSSIDEAGRKPNENNTRKSFHQHPSLMSQLTGHCFCFSMWNMHLQPA